MSPDGTAWARELIVAVDTDNHQPGTLVRESLTASCLLHAPVCMSSQVDLVRRDFDRHWQEPLELLRSDSVADYLAINADFGLNVILARMTVPGGPWPGHYGLEAVVFSATNAVSPPWFPPAVEPYELHFGALIDASAGFARGHGCVLFPEQISVAQRSGRQPFGVVFLDRLAALYRDWVFPMLAHRGQEWATLEEFMAVRAEAFLAHEWGHSSITVSAELATARRRRLVAVVSEIAADLSAIAMVSQVGTARAASVREVLVADRVAREAWLTRPGAQVDSIAARHLIELLQPHGILRVDDGGLTVSFPESFDVSTELARARAAELSSTYDDYRPALNYLEAGGWEIGDGTIQQSAPSPVAEALRAAAPLRLRH